MLPCAYVQTSLLCRHAIMRVMRVDALLQTATVQFPYASTCTLTGEWLRLRLLFVELMLFFLFSSQRVNHRSLTTDPRALQYHNLLRGGPSGCQLRKYVDFLLRDVDQFCQPFS